MNEALVDVVYLDGTESTVSNDVLDVLVATEKISVRVVGLILSGKIPS
jgi:hypothetical protein